MKKNNGKKFDIILMNPPYSKNLHLKFMKKCLNIISENGELIYIGPDNWLIDKYGYSEKSKLRVTTKEEYSKHIDEIEIFSKEEFNKYFGTSNWFGVSIFKMNHYTKGIDYKKFESDDKLMYKIITTIQSKFKSLRSHFTRKSNEKYFMPVRRTNHGYLNWIDKYFIPIRLRNNGYLNWVEKDISKIKAKNGILFDNENEIFNFIESFDTWLYQFLNCTDWKGAENSADVPYLGDYTHKWTDEMLYEIFNINEEEQKFIEKQIKEKHPWKK